MLDLDGMKLRILSIVSLSLKNCDKLEILMTDTIRVQIIFSADTDQGRYNDSLFIPFDEYETMSVSDIEAMKQARVDAWVAAVKLASANSETVE